MPAFVWRGGFLRRALIIGGTVGVSLAALAWIDSGILLAGVMVLVIVGLFYGIWMPRRMARYWPGAKQLDGDDRVTVARTARRGERIGDARLAQAVVDYSQGMHAADERADRFDGSCHSFSSSGWERRCGTRYSDHGAMRWRRASIWCCFCLNCSGGPRGGTACWLMPTAPRRSPSIS